jgi:iron uptake system component EfeO
MKVLFLIGSLLALGAVGCSSSDSKSDADYSKEVTTSMHQTLLADIEALHQASVDLNAAAPVPEDRGWSADADADALRQMTDAWKRARSAYERIEGALAPLFPDIDKKIDARYDDFLEELGPEGDPDPFDAEGVTGMHAIERILFSNVTPQAVIETESTLPGYVAASFPETPEQAREFKDELSAQLVADTDELRQQWTPQRMDIPLAFSGLVGLMNEQREKVNKAATAEEESRYSQRTLADLRDNLAGTEVAYRLFVPWLESKRDGASIEAQTESAFSMLEEVYSRFPGDALPVPPDTWSSENPSEADLSSDFGQLYSAVQTAVNPNQPGSAVDSMNRTAEVLGFANLIP